MACDSTSGCQTGSQKMIRDAEIRFLEMSTAPSLENTEDLQSSGSVLQLHQKNPISFGRLEREDKLFSILYLRGRSEMQKFHSDQFKTFTDIGKGQWRLGKYQEFFSSAVLQNLVDEIKRSSLIARRRTSFSI